MKIAVVFTGHARGYKKIYENFKKHLLDVHDVDLYISTWSVDNPGRAAGHAWAETPPIDLSPMIEMYKPKKIFIEDHNKYYANRFSPIDIHSSLRPDDVFKVDPHAINEGSLWVERMRDMWHIIKQGFDLIDNPTDYDILIRLRFDIILNSFVIQDTIGTNNLVAMFVKDLEVHDLLMYGLPASMMAYSKLFDYIELMYVNNNVNISHSDLMLGTYLKKYCNITTIGDPSISVSHAPWN